MLKVTPEHTFEQHFSGLRLKDLQYSGLRLLCKSFKWPLNLTTAPHKMYVNAPTACLWFKRPMKLLL